MASELKLGQAIHQHLCWLDDQASAYTIKINGGEELAVVNHEPDHLTATYDGPNRVMFVNYANIATLEVLDHG